MALHIGSYLENKKKKKTNKTTVVLQWQREKTIWLETLQFSLSATYILWAHSQGISFRKTYELLRILFLKRPNFFKAEESTLL